MSFEVPEHVTPIRERVREFIETRIYPVEQQLDERNDAESRATMQRLMREAKEAGLWALGHPAEIGGGGLPFMDFVYLNEIIGRSEHRPGRRRHARRCRTRSCSTCTPRRAARALPQAARAGGRFSLGSGSPSRRWPAATRRRCRRRPYLDGDEWVINGHKWFTSGATRAAFTTVFAKTEPDGREARAVQLDHRAHRHARLRLVQRAVPTMGHVGGQHCEVVLRRTCACRATNLLGNRGAGLPDHPEAARAGPHLPLHALARPGPAGVRADVRTGARALRARLAAGREGRDPADDRPSRRPRSRRAG